MKTREVYCVRVHSNIKEPVRVENKHCRAEDKPAQHEENCNTTVCPPQWKESSWGSVSNTPTEAGYLEMHTFRESMHFPIARI